MPILQGYVAQQNIERKHTCWYRGDVGGGKTALAFRHAYAMLKNKVVRYCVSNIPSVICDDLKDVIPMGEGSQMTLDTVVILDEAGMFLNSSRDIKEYTAFLRKLNIILLMPSVEDVPSNVKGLSISRVLNGKKLGVNGWVYEYVQKTSTGYDKEKFVWWNPSEMFGIYDTDAKPRSDEGISDWINYMVETLAEEEQATRPEWRERAEQWRQKRKNLQQSIQPLADEGRDGELFLEASENFREAAEALSLSQSKRRKKRFFK